MLVPEGPVTVEDEESHNLGVKVWFQGICTAKKTGMSALVKNVKPKVIYVLPGRVAMIKSETEPSLRLQAALTAEKVLFIDDHLKASVSHENGKELVFEYPDRDGTKKEMFVFETEQSAAECLRMITEERTRMYIHSDNFTPKFKEDLNTAIRFKIQSGDAPLGELFLACCNRTSPAPAVEALFTNYRTMMDFQESPLSFADLLSAVAKDPVVYILFLCCTIDAGGETLQHFQRMCGHEIDSSAELFEKLLNHITSTVSKGEWRTKRDLLLKQFQYPEKATLHDTSGITSFAVYNWTLRFTENYQKFPVTIHVLNRLLVDEKYLCYACLQHHADAGYTDIVQAVFPTVPQDYLFSSFDTDVAAGAGGQDGEDMEDGDANDNPWHRPTLRRTQSAQHRTLRPHFVDFLFHRNLSERSVFNSLLMAFKQGQGYDEKFFTMFLTEAISNDRPRVAVDVISKLLFLEDGECSVHAVNVCPKIAVILLEALVQGILGAETKHAISDDMRLLFEIAIRFQYFALRRDLQYMRRIDQLFQAKPEKIQQFMQLVEAMKFLRYAIDVCNHNLTSREACGARAVRLTASQFGTFKGSPNANPAGGGGGGLPPRNDSFGQGGRSTPTMGQNYSATGSGREDPAAQFSAAAVREQAGEEDDGDIPILDMNGDSQHGSEDNQSVGSRGSKGSKASKASKASQPKPAPAPAPAPAPYHRQNTPPLPPTADGGSRFSSRYTNADQSDTASVTSYATGTNTNTPTFGSARRLSSLHADGKFSQWRNRTDGNLIALIYGLLTLLITCGELPAPKALTVKENASVLTFLEGVVPAFYAQLMQPNTALRAALTEFLRSKFRIIALYNDILKEPVLLSKPQHFRYSFLHGLSYDARFLTPCMVSLVRVAVMVEQYEDLYARLDEIDGSLGRSQEQQQQLEIILHYVQDREPAELVQQGIKLQDLAALATAATDALAEVRRLGKAGGEHRVLERVEQVLGEAPVAEWAASFAPASLVALD